MVIIRRTTIENMKILRKQKQALKDLKGYLKQFVLTKIHKLSCKKVALSTTFKAMPIL